MVNTNLDTTPLPPNNFVAQDPQSAELAGYVRTKTFGRDVRESIARSIELNSTRSKSAEVLANETLQVTNRIKEDTATATQEMANQVELIRAEKDAVIANATVDSEVILARGGKATLGQRLDETDTRLEKQVKSFYETGDNKPFVTFIDDDGTIQFVERLKPIFDAENVKCSLAINPGVLGRVSGSTRRMVLNELLDVQADGYEIVSHGHEHLNMGKTDNTDEALENELKNAKNFMKENGLNGYDYFVYPNGVRETDYRTQSFVRKYHKCGVGIAMSYTNNAPIKQFALHRINVDSRSLADLKSDIDSAIENNEWVIFLSHAWYEGYTPTKITEVQELVQYIKSKNIGIGTLEDGLKHFGNSIDYQSSADNYLRVSKQGKIDSSENIVNNVNFAGAGDNSNLLKPVTDYEKQTLTIQTFATGYSSAPGGGLAGVCHTYRPLANDNHYSYQEWTAHTTGEKYVRYWNTTTNTWREWEKLEKSHYKNAGGNDDINKPGNEYERGETFQTFANKYSNAPSSSGGLMKTTKPYAGDSYIIQEWTVYTSSAEAGATYKRIWKDGVWTSWVLQ